ncbi:MAG: hypothetical protein AAF911_13395 [Planctomycetota bacterium]
MAKEELRTLGNGLTTFRTYGQSAHLLTCQLTHDSPTPPVRSQSDRPNLWRTYTYDANKKLSAVVNNVPGK